jgi:ABC-type phosphate transport system substrate-binding protein
MKKQIIILLLMASFGLLEAREMGVVIAGKDVGTAAITKEELANIFLGKKTIWDDGSRIAIGYMPIPADIADSFFDTLLGHGHQRFKKYWLKKVFAGYGIAPKLFKSVEFVERNEGSIAFVTVSDIRELGNARTVLVDGKMGF